MLQWLFFLHSFLFLATFRFILVFMVVQMDEEGVKALMGCKRWGSAAL